MKERFRKFNESLAASMAVPMTYAQMFCLFPIMKNMGVWVFLICIFLFALCYLEAYLLYKLIGGVGRTEVDQDRRMRGYFSLFVVSMLLMVGYLFFIEEADPVGRWIAWLLMVLILFVAAYSISKNYILKTK